MEFWCTVIGENFSFPFERAEESQRRRRRRQRLGQMKRESASRHREPFQRESLCHGRFPFPPISTKIFTLFELFHAKCRGIYTIFRRIFCPRRGESGQIDSFFPLFSFSRPKMQRTCEIAFGESDLAKTKDPIPSARLF